MNPSLHDQFAHDVARRVERDRARHPHDPGFCVHGLPLTFVADPSQFPDFIRKGTVPRFRVHCSACVVQAVKSALRGKAGS